VLSPFVKEVDHFHTPC